MTHPTRRSPGSALLAVAALVLVAGALGAQVPESPHGDLSISCSECHTTEGWTPLLSPLPFDHSVTGFRLEAAHRTVRCESCHEELVFAHVGSACADCHLDPHLGELGFGCEDCHGTSSWDARASVGDMHDATLFPLTGAHRATDCAACHTEDPPFEFQLTPTDCFTCHVEDYQSAELDHVALGFPTTCEDCHSTDAFQPASLNGGNFDHDAFFPLRGAHVVLGCGDCHSGGFGGISSECFACHEDDYLGTTDPNHQALGFPLECENCHSTTMWEGASNVDHDTFFPLNGAHAVLDCVECHAAGFEGTPTDCYSCHREDYNATDDPNHLSAGFGTDCEDCHGESTWLGATVDHDAFFPLRGAHATLDCLECHADGYAGTPTDCYACHQEDYDGTTDPNHAASGFPTSCEDCHGTGSWDDAVLDHDAFFPLTGAHAPLDCEACHAGGFEGTPTDCYSCHVDDYNGTTDPNHQQAGFPTDCEVCHSTSTWQGAQFDHSVFWPLTGSHQDLDCEACHADGYPGTPTECVGCHLDDYNQTNDPNHQDAGFPTTCELCHNTGSWDDADFNHSVFWPLTGAHQSLDCEACHADGYPGTPTECVGCHLDDYNQTNDPDHQAAGFPTTCEDCHNTGSWDDADFNHDQMYFPIYSGRHDGEWDTCADCHVVPNDFGVFECIFCHAHEQPETDNQHENVGGYVYDSQACYNCHPDGQADD